MVPPEDDQEQADLRAGRERADHVLVQAEQFKASVAAPKGMVPFNFKELREKFVMDSGLAPVDAEIKWLRNFDQDDKFFHVTCQVDDQLKRKIGRGEYVELDRLLPNDQAAGSNVRLADEEKLMQFVVRGDQQYFKAADSGKRITNIRKWDQVF